MKRTREELSERFRQVVASQSEDDIAEYLEDISDSFPDKDYDSVVKERDDLLADLDAWKAKAEDYRTRYINRFYDDYDKPNSKGYINSSAPQEEIEDAERGVRFEDLFE